MNRPTRLGDNTAERNTHTSRRSLMASICIYSSVGNFNVGRFCTAGTITRNLPFVKVNSSRLHLYFRLCTISPMSKEKQYPTPFQRATCWAALSGLALTTLIVLIGVALFGLGHLFVTLEPVLLPVVIAGILAYLLFPATRWVQEKLVKRRIWAVLIVLMTTAIGITGLGFAIIPPLVQQSGELVSKRHQILSSSIKAGHDLLETNAFIQQGVDMLYQKTINDAHSAGIPTDDTQELSSKPTYADKVTAILDFNSSYLTEKGIEWLTAGTRAISGVAAFFIGIIMVPVFLFYFLLESERIASNWHDILPLRDSHFRDEVVATLQQINNYIISFVRGQMLVSLIDGILLGIALKWMGLPYAITIAAAASLLGIIPYIGMISTSIPALLIAWFTWHDLSHVVAVASIFICVSQFDGWVIQPRVIGNRVGMHDLTIMFSVLFWSLVLGGVVGALLAVPLTAAIKVLFIRYVWTSLSQDGKSTEFVNLTHDNRDIDTMNVVKK